MNLVLLEFFSDRDHEGMIKKICSMWQWCSHKKNFGGLRKILEKDNCFYIAAVNYAYKKV